MYHAYHSEGLHIPGMFDEYDAADEAAGEDGFVVEITRHFQRDRDVTTLYANGDEGTVTQEVVFNDNPMIFVTVNGRSTACLRVVEAKHLRDILDEKIAEAEKIRTEYAGY